uniref:bifunctional folylpolyglutamate synthase/dihydrofolate synthase n=1 Tax=Agathobacter sp. TaxID=2021311 RepID=UPI004057C504
MKYNYEEVITIIQNTRRFGKLTGYEVSKRMLEQLGNPHKDIPFVHIAGTNGKGSATAFLCEILKQTGKKIGMFTSPHLVTFEERIRISGEYISKEEVTCLGNQLLETQFDVPPTMFDYCLCMAVLYFKEQQCDLMVMETGIGGRFDSTNALGTPLVSVITKIGFDHMAILGNTLEEIAYEKAGIIKKGVPVILQKQDEAAYRVICDYVRKLNAENTELSEIHVIANDKDCENTNQSALNRNCQNTNQLAANRNSQNMNQLAENRNCESINQLTDDKMQNQEVSENGEMPYIGMQNNISEYIIEVSQPIRDYISMLPMKMLGNFQVENAAAAALAAAYILGGAKIEERKLIGQKEFIKTELADMLQTTDRIPSIDRRKTIDEIQNTDTIKNKGKIKNASQIEPERIKATAKQSIKQNDKEIINKKELPHELYMLHPIHREYIKQGIAQAVWKGRMELINKKPFFMVDGAHNPDGVHALAESLKALYPNEKFHFIMAVMADKDYENMIEELIPLAYDFVTVTPEYSRALQAKELAECIAKKGIKATYAEKLRDVIVPLLPSKDNVEDAISLNKDGRDHGKTIAFGSLYFIGEILLVKNILKTNNLS